MDLDESVRTSPVAGDVLPINIYLVMQRKTMLFDSCFENVSFFKLSWLKNLKIAGNFGIALRKPEKIVRLIT